ASAHACSLAATLSRPLDAGRLNRVSGATHCDRIKRQAQCRMSLKASRRMRNRHRAVDLSAPGQQHSIALDDGRGKRSTEMVSFTIGLRTNGLIERDIEHRA